MTQGMIMLISGLASESNTLDQIEKPQQLKDKLSLTAI